MTASSRTTNIQHDRTITGTLDVRSYQPLPVRASSLVLSASHFKNKVVIYTFALNLPVLENTSLGRELFDGGSDCKSGKHGERAIDNAEEKIVSLFYGRVRTIGYIDYNIAYPAKK
jgi:hypothetical protein